MISRASFGYRATGTGEKEETEKDERRETDFGRTIDETSAESITDKKGENETVIRNNKRTLYQDDASMGTCSSRPATMARTERRKEREGKVWPAPLPATPPPNAQARTRVSPKPSSSDLHSSDLL